MLLDLGLGKLHFHPNVLVHQLIRTLTHIVTVVGISMARLCHASDLLQPSAHCCLDYNILKSSQDHPGSEAATALTSKPKPDSPKAANTPWTLELTVPSCIERRSGNPTNPKPRRWLFGRSGGLCDIGVCPMSGMQKTCIGFGLWVIGYF